MITQTRVGKHTVFFEPGKHKFTDERGKGVNSVTKFTGLIDKSGPLIYWAVGLMKNHLLSIIDAGTAIMANHIEEGSKLHNVKKKEAGDIGTEIHDLVEKWIKGLKYEIPDNEKVRNGFNAFLEFQKQYKIKWLASEEIIGYWINKMSTEGKIEGTEVLFAGIADALAEIDGKLILVDFKSSKGIYAEMYFQVAAYQMALEQMIKDGTVNPELKKALGKYKTVDHRMIIKFGKEDGSFEFIELHDNDKDKKAFLALVDAKNRLIEIEKNSN